jgi:hypothetical protein
MTPEESARMQQLERQVAFLYRHLGLNPNLTGSDPGQPPVFSSPAEVFGTPAAHSDGRPAAFAPPSFSSPHPVQAPTAPGYQAPAAPGYGDGQQAPAPVAGLVPGPADCPPAVMEAISRGKLVVAIKIYRELTGAGLREAKEAVEGFAGTSKRARR